MRDEPNGWALGLSYFAAFMLIIGGVFEGIIGLSAIVNDDFYVTTQKWVFTCASSRPTPVAC